MSKGHKYVEPQRQCAACRELKGKKELLRLVRSPEGQLSLDPSGKKPGRGAYLCLNRDCLKKAQKARSLERALSVKPSPELWEEIEREISAHEQQTTTAHS